MYESCCKCFGKLALKDSWYGLHQRCFKDWFNLQDVGHFLDLVARSQSQAPQENQMANISFFQADGLSKKDLYISL